MIVRLAKSEDMVGLVALHNDYTGEHLRPLNVVTDKSRIIVALSKMVRDNSTFVAVQDDKIIGVMAGTITPSVFSNDMYFVSMFFYFKPDCRRYSASFIRHLENMMMGTNITRLIIGIPALETGDKMERFYSFMGFKKLETHYSKAV
jgi:hypothetical protein